MKVAVGNVDDLAPGQLGKARLGKVQVVVVRKRDGSFRVLRDKCSHQAGALSEGRLEPMVEGDALGEYLTSPCREVIRCPLHQWEFDVDTGLSPAFPERVRVASYEVSVSDGQIWVEQ